MIMAAIAVFLTIRAVHALSADHGNFLTTFEWNPNAEPAGLRHRGPGLRHRRQLDHRDGHRGARRGRHRAVHLALRPAQARRARSATSIDLLAAVPRIVYGLWGALFLVPHLTGLYRWLDHYLGWTGVFELTRAAPPARCSPSASCWRS